MKHCGLYFISIFVIFSYGCAGHPYEAARYYRPSIEGSWKTKEYPMVLTFRPDGFYEVDYSGEGKADIRGKYELRFGKIRMDYEEALDVTDCVTPGFFYYEINKKELSFQELGDQCRPRKFALRELWQKIP